MSGYTATARLSEELPCDQPISSVRVSLELIEEYLEALEKTGCVPKTLKVYRLKLKQLYHCLAKGKRIQADTLVQWRDALLAAGYAPARSTALPPLQTD